MKIETLLSFCHFRKIEGIPIIEVLKRSMELVFTNKSWNRTIGSDTNEENTYKKDVIYRFLNSGKYHWEQLVALLSVQVITIIDCSCQHLI